MANLKKVKRAMQRPAGPPANDDPREELRRLVKRHKALTRAAVALDHMSSDRVNHATGETIPCLLPEDDRIDLKAAAKRRRESAAKLESLMKRELKKIPIWNLFLSKIWGMGPVIGSYIIAEVSIKQDPLNPERPWAEKPSQLRRFMGFAVIDGALERRKAGQKNAYSSEMRTRVFQFFAALWKNGAQHNVSTKYLRIWTDYKHRMDHSERVDGGKIVNGAGRKVSAKGFVHSTGWHKAADVFIYDLYTVWRALEGLPVWPTYREAKLGVEHLGAPIEQQGPRMLTVEEALREIGEVGPVPIPDAAE